MPTAWIDLTRGTVSLHSKRLKVKGIRFEDGEEEHVTREIPIRDLDRVILSGSLTITGPALSTLMREAIPVVLLGGGNEPLIGSFLPAAPAHAQARLLQYRRGLDPQWTIGIATRLVEAKIRNQRRALQRLATSRNRECPALEPLAASASLAARVGAPGTLLGVEGQAAATYWTSWASFLPAEFPFERRSRRPPLNAVNACLSFISTLLYYEMVAAIHSIGLDPGIGAYHVTENDRWSLALDLIEPFRPIIVEPLTLDLFSRAILQTDHFESRDGGVYLAAGGRSKLILQYEKRLEREFLSDHCGHRTTLRRQILAAARQLKSALDDPEAFRAFLMN